MSKEVINNLSKVKLFTHNDLDGIGCEILGKLAFDNIDVTIVKNPNDASQKVEEFIYSGEVDLYDKVFITDISVNMDVANAINEYCPEKFVLLDHHATANELNIFEWAKVKVFDSNAHKESGTSMFFDYLDAHGFFIAEIYRDAIIVFAEKVRRYDTWEWKEIYGDQEASDLNSLFFLLSRSRFVDTMINKFKRSNPIVVTEGRWLQMISPTDRMIIEIDNDKTNSYIQRKNKQMTVKHMKINKKVYSLGVVFAEQHISALGNKLSEMHDYLDFIAIIDMGSNKVSYRTIHDHIDLGKYVASQFGGGGHAKASGNEFSESILNLTTDMIFGMGIAGKITKVVDMVSKK